MKSNFYVEIHSEKFLEKDFTNRAKEIWKEKGNLVKDLNSLDVYFKPYERKCYYVFNEKETGSFDV